jgi:hypothetical protein
MRKRSALVLAGTTIAALAVMPTTADANHSWGGYHWARTANPFTLTTGDNVGTTWDAVLDTAISDWTASSVMDLSKTAGTTTGKLCRMSAGTIQVCNASYGQNGWLGLASINITGGTHITQGSAKMNDSYFNQATYNNVNEKRHVMCQEVGHTFGLGHTSEDGTSQNTCMDYFSNTGANAGSTVSTHPNAHDYALLESIYAHLDATSTVKATSASSPGVGNDRASWGVEVEHSADFSQSVFVRDFGGGNLVVTHVSWAHDHQAAARAQHEHEG